MTDNLREKRKIKLTLAYDGTAYIGWQRQPSFHGTSIQEVVEKNLTKLLREKIAITGAGRTDSGVHALGQVAHFYTQNPLPAENLPRALNRLLPWDIMVVSADDADNDFHCRYDAKCKTYRYVLSRHLDRSPFQGRYFWQLGKELDLDKMREAASLFMGEHDFSNFAASGCVRKSYRRTVTGLDIVDLEDNPCVFPWQKVEKGIYIDITADGFLYKMARLIVAVLVLAGLNQMSLGEIEEYLGNTKPLTIMPAPAQGLMLLAIDYK